MKEKRIKSTNRFHHYSEKTKNTHVGADSISAQSQREITNMSGITLIALVITIIILLLLAGIVLNLTLGESGIIKKAEQSGIAYDEQVAREKLEIVLLDLQAEKVINVNYNDDYINTKIEQNGMIVSGNIVFVDGWQFQIDRSVPKIGLSLGKGQEEKQIKITMTPTVTNDYVKGNISTEITYEGKIASILLNGKTVEVPQKENGKYNVEQEITENGIYTILVKDVQDKYNIATTKVSDITEDMDIWNKLDMENFRNKVNEGRTFEGKTARVMADINLEGGETNQWIPIATEQTDFKGTFEGNGHTISGIFIKSNKQNQGLFRKIKDATVRNFVVDNSNILGAFFVGGIAGAMENSTIENVHINSNVNITANQVNSSNGSYVGGLVGNGQYNNKEIKNSSNEATITGYGHYVGGIVGVFAGKIEQCYNKGNISVVGNYEDAGGITSHTLYSTVINNCYNSGNVKGYICVGGIVGECHSTGSTLTITNCYNCGTVTGSSYVSEIIGKPITVAKATNCYTKSQGPTVEKLGNAYTNDIQNEDKTWKYNNGYPILKWQLQKRE